MKLFSSCLLAQLMHNKTIFRLPHSWSSLNRMIVIVVDIGCHTKVETIFLKNGLRNGQVIIIERGFSISFCIVEKQKLLYMCFFYYSFLDQVFDIFLKKSTNKLCVCWSYKSSNYQIAVAFSLTRAKRNYQK